MVDEVSEEEVWVEAVPGNSVGDEFCDRVLEILELLEVLEDPSEDDPIDDGLSVDDPPVDNPVDDGFCEEDS